MALRVRRIASQIFAPKLPQKFFHVVHLANFHQLIEQLGKDGPTALSTIAAVKDYSWNYQKCFVENMFDITSYHYQKTRDVSVLQAIGVFVQW